MNKWIVLAVIVLFIGIAAAPSLNADISKPSVENEFDIFFDATVAKLNAAETEDEVISILCDAIVKMDELGVLPEDVSVEELQQMITGNENDLENSYSKNIPSLAKVLAPSSVTKGYANKDLEMKQSIEMGEPEHKGDDIVVAAFNYIIGIATKVRRENFFDLHIYCKENRIFARAFIYNNDMDIWWWTYPRPTYIYVIDFIGWCGFRFVFGWNFDGGHYEPWPY